MNDHLLSGDNPHKLAPAPELSHIHELSVNVNTRDIFIGGEIDDDFGDWFTVNFRYLAAKNDDPITVWLDTQGGDVNSMFVFQDIVSLSPIEIRVVGYGSVCSAGVLMLACGHKRYVTESCILMSHEGSGGMEDSIRFSEMKERMKMNEWSINHWANLMARYTPNDANWWKKTSKSRAEWWVLGGADIVAAGLADEVLTRETFKALLK